MLRTCINNGLRFLDLLDRRERTIILYSFNIALHKYDNKSSCNKYAFVEAVVCGKAALFVRVAE